MSVLRLVVNWASAWHREYKIPKGYLLLKYKPKYRKNVATALQKLDTDQVQRIMDTEGDWQDALRDIDCTLEIHYQKRTLPANNLMWALYEIEANEQNAGRIGHDMVKPAKLYRDDMREYAPTLDLQLTQDELELLKRTYSMVDIIGYDGEKAQVRLYVTSSHWNTKEMHQHIEMLFDRLSAAGVENTADISHYWFEWRQKLNEDKLELHDAEYTVEEYKDLVKNCEACGTAVWHDDIGSSCAHIKAVGMGGHREKRYYGRELMHLCDSCHAMYDNGKGRDAFVETYPHLRNKIETELRREL